MADKQPENNGLFELIKKIWSPIAGVLGALLLLLNFYQIWLGNQALLTYIFAGIGLSLLIIALVFIVTRTKLIIYGSRRTYSPLPHEEKVSYYPSHLRKIAIGGLVLISLTTIVGVFSLIQHRKAQENKLIVLIAEFEGPEDVYGLRNEIIENLNTDFSGDKNIEVILIDEIITLTKGSEYARKLGENHLADVVIWGWYRPTENPNINIYIENLSPNQLIHLQESETFQPVTTISELESFSFQQQTGDETSALISFLAGFIEYQSENYETAIEYFDISLETLPPSPLLFENKVEIYSYRGNSNISLTHYEEAIQDYDQVIQINPQYARAYNNRGIAYANLSEYERAIQDYDQAIQINPQYALAYNNRGIAYANLSEYERAIQDFDQAIQINPQYANAYNNRGIAYDNLGEYERAIQDYDQAIQINPQDALAYNNRGIVYANLSEYERAIQDYDQAIQINPQDALAYNNRGVAYANLSEYERAIQDFDQAIQINPQYVNAYYNRGVAYDKLGEYERAIQDFDQAIQINPQDAAVYGNRGIAYAKLGEYERAIQDFDQAIQINPQDAAFYGNRGIAYDDLGQYEHSIQDYNQVLKINPQDALAYYNRGVSYQALGKTAEAEADFAKYKELTGQDAP